MPGGLPTGSPVQPIRRRAALPPISCVPSLVPPHRHGYFAACPAREYLPLFWTDAQLELLQGTELAERVQADRCAAALLFAG